MRCEMHGGSGRTGSGIRGLASGREVGRWSRLTSAATNRGVLAHLHPFPLVSTDFNQFPPPFLKNYETGVRSQKWEGPSRKGRADRKGCETSQPAETCLLYTSDA